MFCILIGPLAALMPTVSFCQVVEPENPETPLYENDSTGKTDSSGVRILTKKDRFFSSDTIQQVQDTTLTALTKPKKKKTVRFGKKNPNHSWKTATWMSAALPGLGQIYNGKWWKVPIVYGALGATGYFMVSYHLDYIGFRDSYRDTLNGINLQPPYTGYKPEQLRVLRDESRNNRDLFIILTTVMYTLNIVDAMVDGHLYRFDVNDDLSLKIQPNAGYLPMYRAGYVGLSLTFGLRR